MPMYDDDYEDEDYVPRRRRGRVVVVREPRGSLSVGSLLNMLGAKDLKTATDPALTLNTAQVQSAVNAYADKQKTAGLIGLVSDGGLGGDSNGLVLALALTGGI